MRQLLARGQIPAINVAKGIAVLIVVIVVMGFAYSMISESTIEQESGTTYPYENSLENAGTAYLTINAYDEIKSGTLSGELLVSDNVQLTITLNDTVVENVNTGSDNIENTVTSLLQDGTNTWVVTIDNADRLSAAFTTTLSATTYDQSLGEDIAGEAGSKVPMIFKLMLIVAIVAVIAVVLRAVGVF